jgi:hypothetical protein
MKPERIGKIVNHKQKPEDDNVNDSTQNLEMMCIPRNIDIVPTPGFDALGSVQADDSDDIVYESNPKLRRFKAKRSDQLEIVIDVAFLQHIIKTIIENHGVVLSPKDTEDILGYFGECVVKTEHVAVLPRGAEEPRCGCSKKQQQEFMDVVKSVLLNGMKLGTQMPQFVQFLGNLGLSI